MTSLAPLRALRPLTRRVRAASRSCAGDTTPPERPRPPPRARPACRPPPPRAQPAAERRVCCAPPRARQPPCAPRPTLAPLVCADAKSARACRLPAVGDEPCASGTDRVARRLAAAAAARRLLYEEEVRERAARCAPACPGAAPYAPGAARQCLRALDGRAYTLPCALPPAARCGPDRAPPPPEPLPALEGSDAACTRASAPDPCAHRPRVFLEVDRSAPPPPPPPPVPPRGLAERIAAGLRGRRPSERPERGLHTSAVARSLDSALRERTELREAGRGRESIACVRAGREEGGVGRLELPVPAGAAAVRVLVSLGPRSEGDARGAAGEMRAQGATAERAVVAAGAGRRNSWLSLGSIQRKLSGCGRDAPPACPPRPAVRPTCPPPRAPAPTPAPASSPCTPPLPQKSKPSPCDRKGSDVKFSTQLPFLTMMA